MPLQEWQLCRKTDKSVKKPKIKVNSVLTVRSLTYSKTVLTLKTTLVRWY